MRKSKYNTNNRQSREHNENVRRASSSATFEVHNLEAFRQLIIGSRDSINSLDDNLYAAARPENYGGAYVPKANHNQRTQNLNANQRGGQSNRGAIKRGPHQRNLGNPQNFHGSQNSLNLGETFLNRPPRRSDQNGQNRNQSEMGRNTAEPHRGAIRRPNQRNVSNSRNLHGSQNSLNSDELLKNWSPRRNGQNSNQSEMGENSNGTEPNRRRQHNGPYIGFKYLENLIATRSPEELVVEMMKNQDKFAEYVKTKLNPDIIVLLVHVFAHVAHSKFTSNLGQVLITFANEDYMAQLVKYIMELPLQERREKERNRYFWEKSDVFWSNLSYLCSKLLDVSPNTAIDLLPRLIKVIIYTILNLERSSTVASDEIKTMYENLQIKLLTMTEEKDKKEIRRRNKFDVDDDEMPPDDFHDISIYPKPNELLSNTSVFVRRNIIDRKYNDVDHYLDVHFRLLREDFVSPLRKGITEYLTDDHKKRLSNIKVYQKVKFLHMERVQNQMGFLVQVFPSDKKLPIRNIENTKRLMFGSLVCFTPDKFQTIYFGKVIDRKKELLLQGQIIVGFELEVLLDPNVEYTMVECLIYFEPYYQVLKALQNVSIEDFPLKKYLVDVEPCTEAPLYIQQNPVLKIDQYHLRVTDEYNWPEGDDLGLNSSQFNAFRHALNNTFCIIQGPPGTGKTYLGLRVAKTLLKNKDIWKNLGPMLVICYTNHALDQFLEGLLGTTTEIVRVGGQSKNENLAKYNIKNLRFNSYIRRSSVLRDKEIAIQSAGAELNKWTKRLQAINECKTVLDFRFFYAIEPEFAHSWFYRTTEEEILKWLLEQPGQIRSQRKVDFAVEKIVDYNSDDDIELDEDDATKNHVDIEDDFFKNLGDIDTDTEIVSLEKLMGKLQTMHGILQEAQKTGMTYEHHKLYEEFEITVKNYEYLQMRLEQLQTNKLIEEPRLKDLSKPQNMSPDDRWLLYSSWLRRYKYYITEEMNKADNEYRTCYREYDEVREIIDSKLMKEKLVIGMTTTGAARLQTILQVLKCPIVIVEEAAEVLESHIITALTSSCQHLILIGDHKQLRPSTADYHLDKDYNLGISLFERMVKNNLHCSVLNVQHRMRPEIAALISPNIYPELHNHDSVRFYRKVMGIDKSLFFITHKNPEKESNDNSKENDFEAVYLIKLAKYLVLNGHEPEKITVLSAYAGQLFRLMKERKKYFNLKDLKITVLDNYQGEENEIILLSLVRNNKDNNIGFLHLENRVCVALSRAKHGMYVMGNMDMLCSKSQIWPKIKGVLEHNNSIGRSLRLRCQKHVDTVTEIENLEDFDKVPEGGCMKMCNTKLPCGHVCPKLCHMIPHDQYKCEQPCLKTLCEFNHPCPSMCFEDCGKCLVPKKTTLPLCGHELNIPCFMEPNEVLCPTKVPVTLACGHKTEKSCHMDINKVRCKESCDTRIEPCGHSCMMKCHIKDDPDHLTYKCYKQCERSKKDCTSKDETHKCEKLCYLECDPCNVKVKKERSNCAHFENIECCKDISQIDCKKPCKRIMACGHPCKQKCFEPCGGCSEKVDKVIVSCGHRIKIECSKTPDIKMCKGKCIKTLRCGHKCNRKCKDDCTTAKCKELVIKNSKADCGHYLRVPCYLANESEVTNTVMSYCPEKCNTQLACGHTCGGTCGECAQGRIHKMCQEKCNRILVCGHECNTPCRDMCQPCELPCSYECVHSKCGQKCGVPCTNCVEPCARRCKHQACSKRCSQRCDVEPCQEPCDKILECSHPCIGFCGEPCPPLCLVCNKEEVTEIFFGNEDEEDSRYVYLEECKHLLESTGLDNWFNQADEKAEISFKQCPKCKSKINSTQRYSESIKAANKDVQAVKKKFFGNDKLNKNKKGEILLKMTTLINSFSVTGCPGLNILNEFYDNLKKEKKHHQQLLSSYTSKLEILEQILKAYVKHRLTKPESRKIVENHISYLVKFLSDREGCISDQRIEDFKMELNRLTRVIELAKIMNDSACHFPDLYIYKECFDAIFKFSKYDNHQDAILKQKMKILSEKANSGLNISDQERREILQAMNFTQGHWYKCPNGHIYAIGECGGAMEESNCPECNAKIGGRNHALTAGNAVASEMDGARYAAYSELANNLGNFDLRRFMN